MFKKKTNEKLKDRMGNVRVAVGIGAGNITSVSALLICITFVRDQHFAFSALCTGFTGFFVAGFHHSGCFGTAGFLGTGFRTTLGHLGGGLSDEKENNIIAIRKE